LSTTARFYTTVEKTLGVSDQIVIDVHSPQFAINKTYTLTLSAGFISLTPHDDSKPGPIDQIVFFAALLNA